MNAYEVRSKGAIYWVGAPNVPTVIDLMLALWAEDEQEIEDFSVSKIHDSRARGLHLQDESKGSVSLAYAVAELGEATVLGCSEWP